MLEIAVLTVHWYIWGLFI